jgi:hypothetical protein
MVFLQKSISHSFDINSITRQEEDGMKAMFKVIAFALLGLLAGVNTGHAVTVDSLLRSLNMNDTTIQRSALGTFNEGLSYPGVATDYNSDYGYNLEGARTYQDTNVLNDAVVMTLLGHGGVNLWWKNGFAPSTGSHFSLGFTPLTGATYDFSYGIDGGMVSLQDTVTGDYLDKGLGILIGGHKYQMEADAHISNPNQINYGAFWGLELTVREQPAAVPLPGALLLFGPGLAVLAAVKRKLKK